MGALRAIPHRQRYARALTTMLLLGCIGLTAWVWSLPRSLPAAHAWGERQAWVEQARRLSEEHRANPASDGPAPEMAFDTQGEANRLAFEGAAREAAERYRERYSYRGEDGRYHVYLGDYDGYYWLHFARKLLRSGSLCDPGESDRCLDAQGHAPVGAPLAYPKSLHVFAIAAVHRLADGFLSPGYPMAASAMLVPVIVAALGVLPAFFLGRLLAGNLAGVVAAVTISLHPMFLQRSLGGDNDVWNLVLPLYMIWAATAALSGGWPRRGLFAVLAGAVAGLQATIWQGWVLAFLVVAAGLLFYLTAQTIFAVRADRSLRVWRHTSVSSSAVTLLVFLVATALFTSLAGAGEAHATTPLKAFWSAAGPLFQQEPEQAASVLVWPDILGTVQELQHPTLGMIAGTLGGRSLMLISLIGLLVAYFPQGVWRRWHFGLLFLGVASYTVALASRGLDPSVGLVLIALPPLSGALSSVLERRQPTPAQGIAIILLSWFLAALYLSQGGLRYVFFLAPSFGLALAVCVGRFHNWLRLLCDTWLGRYRAAGASLSFLLLTTILVVPVSKAIETARAYVPTIDDAWWDSLTRLRERSHPQSIVTVWWDYGHWAKFVADRRATADGTSLLTHLPHWVAKALTSPDPNESLGVLRMLDCASEATPLPEGARSAYGRIRTTGRDELAAYSMTSALTVRSRAEAAAYLSDRGFVGDTLSEILAASHCDPPEAYLVLSSDMLNKVSSLFAVGRADPRMKALADRLESLGRDEALAWLAAEFGYSETEASALYRKVEGEDRQADREFVDSAWRPCRRPRDNEELECPLSFFSGKGSEAGIFRYHRGDPPVARFEFDTATKQGQHPGNGPPGFLVLAGSDSLETVEFRDTPYSWMAVLVDPENERILLGSPAVVRSTLIQLLFLEGRYTQNFRKIDERGTSPWEKVSVWRIDWGESQSADETR